MSLAGIRSNRGDFYQTLVAFDWALDVLSDPNYEWLEIDSTTFSVDDVVIGKADGTQIACQCKKNQTDYKAWTVAELADELEKAAHLLSSNQNAEVRFYSRNNFGALAKIREHSATQHNETTYQASLSKENQETDAALSLRIAVLPASLSTFDFLRRTKFETSGEMDRMETLLRARLRNIVSNPERAFDALWTRLDQLGARAGGNCASTATQHRLTKDDLIATLHRAGAILVPPMNLAEIRLSFSNTSAIGRSWRRDIAGHRIVSPILNELLEAIDAKKGSILLTGLPGSGKTCVMLALQEALEERVKIRSDIVPLFIQSREFADLATAEDRQVQGLSEEWVEKAARMAEGAHVIVVIDSLDVLSIARDHRVLTYFLAQIDRLLLIPDITVVTACRDFDRHYDRRIAGRQWGCELKCEQLDWTTEIAPLLEQLGIATSPLDAVTKELIKNPRELALFSELARQGGSFNVVTSQALAQRYLDTIVRSNQELGDAAIQAIEAIAAEMLQQRSLVVPNQRFAASQDIQRKLCSLNVLQETQEGKLTFGHQTLLDVLVISGAVRSGASLNTFIQALPPVPFVRPSIRSFVAQLALGERREFRKQIRTVLTGNAAFHIRRLVAESFAAQIPQDEDWPLIRNLRENHSDVFQVIYSTAGTIEWHLFWLRNLVPFLKSTRDAEGLTRHVHRIAQWSNEDSDSVLSFWMEALSLGYIDSNGIADQLGMHLSEIKPKNIAVVAPLLEMLLDMPRSEHSFLGRAIARCLEKGVVKDDLLWRYIADNICDQDLLEYRFDSKLQCHPHDFGDQQGNFIRQRMEQSTALLDLALDSIERWSSLRASQYGETRTGYRHGFLSESSYADTHSQNGISHVDSMNILLGAVEAGILQQAKVNSDWWEGNRERLCFNHEGALLYFAVQACAASPETNIELVGRMLCDSKMFEFELDFELGALLKSAFMFLSTPVQDAVMVNILNVWSDHETDERRCFWVLKKRAELIVTIPRFLRSPELQAVADAYEGRAGVLIRQPDIYLRGGTVSAPFSFEVFLSCTNNGVLRLLEHYSGHSHHQGSDADFLIGGEREVGWQLREACSRHPTRFLDLLRTCWSNISEAFRDDIMDGAATYLAYRYGNLQFDGSWEPVEEPNAPLLAKEILDELERHQAHWRYRRSAAKALEACANVIQDSHEATRLIFAAIAFDTLHEVNPISGNNVSLISLGINMVKGCVVDALMILANKLLGQGTELPELLIYGLRRFARDEHPAVRALILRRLSYLQSKSFDFGWDLFDLTMQDSNGFWQIAEPCLYHSYRNHFEVVKPLLERLYREGSGKDLETWGRISALSAMMQHISHAELLKELMALDSDEAWLGAATVWTNSENIRLHREQCLAGMDFGLNYGSTHAKVVAEKMDQIFRDKSNVIAIPTELIRQCFAVFSTNSDNKHHRLFGFHEWLNAISQVDPEQALAAMEIYLAYVSHSKPHLYDHENSLTQLMTRLFAEAEEREESDRGAMLQRVVVVQDTLLSLGLNGVVDWLKAAERP